MEQPLFATETEALAAEGEIYKHYKGGVYRLLQRNAKNSETLEDGVVYEHLWPHDHGVWWRPESLFFGKLENGQPRFKLVKSQ